MTVAGELRAQLRAGKKEAPPPWQPPDVTDFWGFTPILGWDATLSHCAWVVAERVQQRIVVHDKGTIHVSTDLTGYAATWEKARLLQPQVREVLNTWPTAKVTVEAPAVAGHRLESSLIASMLIWLETVSPSGTGAAQISRTHVLKVLCGDARLTSAAGKRAVKAAVARYVPESEGRSWNEHERDALATALTRLHDMSRVSGNVRIVQYPY